MRKFSRKGCSKRIREQQVEIVLVVDPAVPREVDQQQFLGLAPGRDERPADRVPADGLAVPSQYAAVLGTEPAALAGEDLRQGVEIVPCGGMPGRPGAA
ncbi:hypothetical protein ACFU6R_06405 [Streptomyces sp. NPDC057499]|uniref:hypothetical protein n=1 Tax=Streptomyces sp. NPDC057499 TaxID=3346150 RepID=UPI0036C3986E